MKSLKLLSLAVALALAGGVGVMAQDGEGSGVDYDVVTAGSRKIVRQDGSDGAKILLEAANLGSGKIEIAELTFLPNRRGRSHVHGSIEIFYVLTGQLTHVVNGKGARLTPGIKASCIPVTPSNILPSLMCRPGC